MLNRKGEYPWLNNFVHGRPISIFSHPPGDLCLPISYAHPRREPFVLVVGSLALLEPPFPSRQRRWKGDSITGAEMKSWEPLTVQPVYCNAGRGERTREARRLAQNHFEGKQLGLARQPSPIPLVSLPSSSLLPARRSKGARIALPFAIASPLHNPSGVFDIGKLVFHFSWTERLRET